MAGNASELQTPQLVVFAACVTSGTNLFAAPTKSLT